MENQLAKSGDKAHISQALLFKKNLELQLGLFSKTNVSTVVFEGLKRLVKKDARITMVGKQQGKWLERL